jgi:hypothetical protein
VVADPRFATALGLSATLLSLVVLTIWLVALQTGRMDRVIRAITLGHGAVVALAASVFFLSSPTWIDLLTGTVLAGSLFFLYAGTHAAQPRGLAVAVGRPILDFTTIAGNGEVFELSSMRGKPYLLKFYRGHW